MAATEIRAEYDQLGQVSSQFTNQAQAIQGMLQNIQTSVSNLDGQWVGHGHENFFNLMQTLVVPVSKRLVAALEEAARSTQSVAKAVKDAEDQASGLFKH